MKKPFDLQNFLQGSQVGRDKVETVTIERDELEKQQKAAERQPWLEIAGKIYADLKWKCKKRDYSKDELLGLIDDAIIEVGLKVKHDDVRREVIAEFQKMKEKVSEA